MLPEFEIFDLLRRHGVPFVVVGGHAVTFHGFQRLTEDMDLVWLRSDESEEALVAALTELDARYIGREIDPATGIERTYPVSPQFVQSARLMMLWTRHGFLDLFDYVPGHPDADVRDLIATSVQSHNVRFASLDWLRRMKRAAGRTKDLLDLENLPEG